MKSNKKYENLLLSVLCIIFFLTVIISVLYQVNDQSQFQTLSIIYIVTILVSVTGGIFIILYRTLKRRELRYSFIYNLFGTVNLVIGFIGLVNMPGDSSYIIPACFAVGLLIYNDIYWRKNNLI